VFASRNAVLAGRRPTVPVRIVNLSDAEAVEMTNRRPPAGDPGQPCLLLTIFTVYSSYGMEEVIGSIPIRSTTNPFVFQTRFCMIGRPSRRDRCIRSR